MQYPDSNFTLDFSNIDWIDYRQAGINQFEVSSTYNDPEIEWYPIHDPQTNERYYYIVGFGSKARFFLYF